MLGADQSAALRQKLLNENITSADLPVGWARAALTAKNTLKETDAQVVENAYGAQAAGACGNGNRCRFERGPARGDRDQETVASESPALCADDADGAYANGLATFSSIGSAPWTSRHQLPYVLMHENYPHAR